MLVNRQMSSVNAVLSNVASSTDGPPATTITVTGTTSRAVVLFGVRFAVNAVPGDYPFSFTAPGAAASQSIGIVMATWGIVGGDTVYIQAYTNSDPLDGVNTRIYGTPTLIVVLPSVDPDAQAVINQMIAVGTDPDATQQARVNTFVVAMKAAGTWAKSDVILGLRAIVNGEGAAVKINWKDPTGSPWVETGAGALTYATSGTTSDGTNYLLGPANMSTFTQFVQDSAHLAVYPVVNAQVNNPAGGDSGSGATYVKPRTGGNVMEGRVNSVAGLVATTASASSIGLFITERHDAVNVQIWKDGTQQATAASVSLAVPARKPAAFMNDGDVGANALGFFSMGSTLTGTEQTALASAVVAYLA